MAFDDVSWSHHARATIGILLAALQCWSIPNSESLGLGRAWIIAASLNHEMRGVSVPSSLNE